MLQQENTLCTFKMLPSNATTRKYCMKILYQLSKCCQVTLQQENTVYTFKMLPGNTTATRYCMYFQNATCNTTARKYCMYFQNATM